MGYSYRAIFLRFESMYPSKIPSQNPSPFDHNRIPKLFANVGERCRKRFIEFFVAKIRNPNTRLSSARAVWRFADWCQAKHLSLEQLNATFIGIYVEQLGRELAAPSVKQHLAAIRLLLDYLLAGHVLEFNPTDAVRGPKHVVKKGKTPVLDGQSAGLLIESIDATTISGIRDRALIGLLVYSFARIGAALAMIALQNRLQRRLLLSGVLRRRYPESEQIVVQNLLIGTRL